MQAADIGRALGVTQTVGYPLLSSCPILKHLHLALSPALALALRLSLYI